MPKTPSSFWNPTEIRRYISSRESSTQVILVNTDLGDGYLKAMGNPEGEHALACEFVGTQLARWFDLPTLEFGIVNVTDADRLPFHRKGKGLAKTGPAFITKADPGEPWGGKKRELKRLVNPNDISRLVVFDTWVCNTDRYSHNEDGSVRRRIDNVFLSENAPAGKLLLRAVDHTHCFTSGREILAKNLGASLIRDNRVFGLFPEFETFLNRRAVREAAADLRQMTMATAKAIVSTIPAE